MSRVPDGFRLVDDHPTLRLAHNATTGESLWVEVIPLCPECMGAIGGACGGPDAPYRPAKPGEPCGAADCQGSPTATRCPDSGLTTEEESWGPDGGPRETDCHDCGDPTDGKIVTVEGWFLCPDCRDCRS